MRIDLGGAVVVGDRAVELSLCHPRKPAIIVLESSRRTEFYGSIVVGDRAVVFAFASPVVAAAIVCGRRIRIELKRLIAIRESEIILPLREPQRASTDIGRSTVTGCLIGITENPIAGIDIAICRDRVIDIPARAPVLLARRDSR